MLPRKLAFVDVETSGSFADKDRIIEIGIVRIENNEVVGRLNTLINPNASIPWFITKITGIHEDDLHTQPTFDEVIDNIDELIKGTTFVAHNVSFDYSFIQGEFRRLRRPFNHPRMCTVKLSRTLYPQFRKHNLDSVSQRFGIDINNRHRAFDDAYALWEFYKVVQDEFENSVLEQAVEKLLHIPRQLQNTTKDQMFMLN